MRQRKANETQTAWLFDQLLKGRTVTPQDALQFAGSMRLGARVFELREMGYPIITTTVAVPVRFGRTAHVAAYKMGAKA